MDGVKVLLAWPHIVRGDLESRKLDSVMTKHKLVRVEGDAMASADVEPVNCLEEALGEVVCPEQRVVDALGLVRDVRDDLVKPPRVPVA